MKTATEIFFDPTIYGHSLVEPVQWYGRQVSQLFTRPFPQETFFSAVEVVARIIAFAVLVVFAPSLVVTCPFALVGWAIKYRSAPALQLPTPGPLPQGPPLPLPSFVPFTPETSKQRDQGRSITRSL